MPALAIYTWLSGARLQERGLVVERRAQIARVRQPVAGLRQGSTPNRLGPKGIDQAAALTRHSPATGKNAKHSSHAA
jgi:hypothetical protein